MMTAKQSSLLTTEIQYAYDGLKSGTDLVAHSFMKVTPVCTVATSVVLLSLLLLLVQLASGQETKPASLELSPVSTNNDGKHG